MALGMRSGIHGSDDRAEGGGRVRLRDALLACGVAYALLYPVVNDVLAAAIYDGYDRLSQAVSELSATGAPSRPFLVTVLPLFSLLQVGFGVGIWMSAHGARSIRVAGALMVAHGGMSFLWLFAPMSPREVIAAGGATSADAMHLALAAGTGLFVAAYVTAFAVAYGWAFRLYSLATLAASLVFGMLSAQTDRIEAGAPTPSMGWLERAGIGAWLIWMAVVAILLLRRNRLRRPRPVPVVRAGLRTVS
jgi:hypothetical protein